MSSSSTARVLDPLAAPDATFLDADASVATIPRTERIAPDVTALGGAEAVAIVRAGGFIAAIESVASELAEGTVIEQEPPAGERLEREGVITLRLATPPLAPVKVALGNEAGLASEQAARTAGSDDTEEWFRALAPIGPDARAGTTSGRRRRKHRRPEAPARERFFDPPPAPSVGSRRPPSSAAPFQRASERANAWLALAAGVCALAPSLAGLQWRRTGALLAGVLLLALLGTRFVASSDRRARPALARAIAPTTDAHVPTRRPAGVIRRRHPSPPPRAGRPRTHTTARAHGQDAEAVARVAAHPVHQAEPSAPATAPAPSAGGQFAYLGQ